MAVPSASQRAYLQDLMRRTLDMGPIYLPDRFHSLGGRFFATAHIANDLGPLFREHIGDQSKIRIVGYDGFSIAKTDYPWRAELVDWVNRGGTVEYLLQNPLPTTLLMSAMAPSE
jgi:hypothetical protein